ncbi:ribonuclease activity regulator [Micractinium conductrix]|uniref:4-hydroxy-4-methyl-2-oxoglutarate aldolase n=1 Tax=Micractinium conductrix TaxID=554055 RepID=A0A2P6V4E1_9CHLO|nr:ribonuclease activity regulator [Micractinium conductrix]|eukprot:PSC68962.1 ribonuclease activity regulator [Micractinium conductrix]
MAKAAAAERQAAVSTADLCDAYLESPVDVMTENNKLAVMQPGLLRDFGGRPAFCGEAYTIKCYEGNVLVAQKLETAGRGRVLVVDGGGSMRCALLGDRLAGLAAQNGWSGIIVHGCVRDTAVLAGLDVGIKALAPCPVKSSKRDPGLKAARLIIGGVQIRPGDWIYADGDGVVVSREELTL